MRHISILALLLIGGAGSVFAGVDSGLLAWVPADSGAVVGIDFDHARNSALSQYVLSGSPESRTQIDDMIKETGFDPRKDLQYGLIAFNIDQLMKQTGAGAPPKNPSGFTPIPAGDFKGEGMLIVLKGKFDLDRITKAMKMDKAKSEKYQGQDLLVSKDNDGITYAITLSPDGILVMGQVTTLKRMLDQRAAHATLTGEMLQNVQRAAEGEDFWLFSKVDASSAVKKPGNNSDIVNQFPQLKALASLTQLEMGLKAGETIELKINGKTNVDQDALNLADGLRFVASMVQMQRQSSPLMQTLATGFDGMKLDAADGKLHFAIVLPEKAVENMFDAFRSEAQKPSADH